MVQIIEPSFKILTPLNGHKILEHIELCGRTCYKSEDLITDDSAGKLIRTLIKSGHESVLEHFSITVKMTVDIGVYKDVTRHRAGTAFSIESTRYCNYSKDKFNNQLQVMKPCNIDEGTEEYKVWLEAMNNMEKSYLEMAAIDGIKSDQLRMMLPHSTKSDVTITANLRAWRHIFKMRADKHAHPAVQQIMKMILLEFNKQIPIIFEDIVENLNI